MKKILIKTFAICMVFQILCLLPCIRAVAEEKSYSVDSAEFDVDIEENGDAHISETWTVTYSKGNFSRFYRDIYKDVKAVEKFDAVNLESCTINGKDCTGTDSIDRIDYHYFYEENSHSDRATMPQ